MTDNQNTGASYAAAGVDIEAGDRAVELFAPIAKKATRPEVRGGLGGFAGLFALGDYKKPLLELNKDLAKTTTDLKALFETNSKGTRQAAADAAESSAEKLSSKI